MSTISQNESSYYYKPRYLETVASSLLLGAGWGAGNYLITKKPYIKDGMINDKFIPGMIEELKKVGDVEVCSFENKADTFTKSVQNYNNGTGKYSEKELADKYSKFLDFYNEKLKKCLDDKNNFLYNSDKISEESFGAIKKASKKYRLNIAAKGAALFTAIYLTGNLIFERIKANKLNKQN